MIQAIGNGTIFDGAQPLEAHAVLLNGAKIEAVIPATDLPHDLTEFHDLDGGTLVPGFIDLQVNGGGGVLFNDEPTVAGIRAIGAAHRQFGTTGFLPTLISDSPAVMTQALEAAAAAIEEGVPGVLGIHLEGPFLNPERHGAHKAHHLRPLTDDDMRQLTPERTGRLLLTVAPEKLEEGQLQELRKRGVLVSAGHSTATYADTKRALAQGLNGFTHLYNAMTGLQSREPGMVGAALEDDHSWFGIIADGHHVHPAALRAAVHAKQAGGALLVTDAMPCVGSLSKTFSLGEETLRAERGKILNKAGKLAGSDLDMLSAVNNAAKFADIDWFEAVRMASLYPARALNLDREVGTVKAGFRANLCALDTRRELTATWIEGDYQAVSDHQ